MQHRRIIKRGPVVLATTENGSIDPSSVSTQGLFLGDTRYLSLFKIRLNGVEPVLLGSSEEALFESSHLQTNPELTDLPARALGVVQHNRLEDGVVVIEIRLINWALKPVDFELSLDLDSDFFDSFETRGVMRVKRGDVMPPNVTPERLELSYVGLDGVRTRTEIGVSPAMARFEDRKMYFPISLDTENRTRTTIRLELHLTVEAPEGEELPAGPLTMTGDARCEWFDAGTQIETSNSDVQAILHRSFEDLEILLTRFPEGWVPAAGLPRFAVPFGRDSLFTGLQTLIWNPELARSVLRFLASRQGKEENPWNYEQPGKIMHEMHTGELARLKEVPFGLFYGSVDSTVLYLLLGAEYVQWTGDLDLYHELKPSFQAAWGWIDNYGDIDGSGYVQYQAHTPPRASSAALTVGLFNQGWKDSSIALAYADGTMVNDHPVALAEVQGYLYRSLHLWGKLYLQMPREEAMAREGERLLARARTLKRRFNDEFWMPQRGFYAMALDGHHRQVDSLTSNPGHCLWARLIDDERAEQAVETLVSEPMMSAWGIRTMANSEKAYNPFSYHNGSVWPFENALIAAGIKKYGFVKETEQVFEAMMDAALAFEYRRWPEVYCGVARDLGGVLARQPDASRPQAWSAGSIFLLLQTWLGLAPRPFSRQIDMTPALPARIRELTVDNLSIAGGRLSLSVRRDGDATYLEVRDNPDDLDITIHPATRDHHRIAHGGANRDRGPS